MDAKRFIQLVEEKKKRALEKKEAPLKWEQKLEAGAKAKADAEAKERKLKAAKHKRRSMSDSDSEGSDGGRKSNKKIHKRHKKHAHSDSGGDNEKRKEKKSKRKPKRQSSSSNDDSDNESESGSDDEDRKRKKRNHRRHRHHDLRSDSSADGSSDDDREAIKRRGHVKRHKHHRRLESNVSDSSCEKDDGISRRRSHAKHHKRHRLPESSASDSSSDEENDAFGRRNHAKHHKRHRRSHSVDSKSSDSSGHRCRRRSESIGKLSDDNLEQAGRQARDKICGHQGHHHHKHRCHNSDEGKNHSPQAEPNGKNKVTAVVGSGFLSDTEIMAYMYMIWLLVTQFLVLSAKTGAKVPAIIVFGDSSVDAGNNNQIPTIARSNFQPYGRDFSGGKPTGRFSNGRIPTDFISEAFGLKPTIPAYLDPAYNISDFAIGVTFASAGSGYDNATSDVLSVIPLWKELEYYKDYQKRLRAYLGETKANEVIGEALHMMSLGTNDFMENYYAFPSRRQSQFTITQFEDFLIGIAGNFIKALYGLGARKISLGGLPPMGCLPLERATNVMGGNECAERYNGVALEFNDKLSKLTAELNKELSGIKLVFSNPYYVFLHIIRRPSFYGIKVTSVACCATGIFEMGYACNQNNLLTCTNADEYVFWDAFHPTQKTSSIISGYLMKNVLAQFL